MNNIGVFICAITAHCPLFWPAASRSSSASCNPHRENQQQERPRKGLGLTICPCPCSGFGFGSRSSAWTCKQLSVSSAAAHSDAHRGEGLPWIPCLFAQARLLLVQLGREPWVAPVQVSRRFGRRCPVATLRATPTRRGGGLRVEHRAERVATLCRLGVAQLHSAVKVRHGVLQPPAQNATSQSALRDEGRPSVGRTRARHAPCRDLSALRPSPLGLWTASPRCHSP